jgi:hypothetical protein
MMMDATTTKTQEDPMKLYQIAYQLGGHSQTYTTIRAARAALKRARKSAKTGGDCQAIWLERLTGSAGEPIREVMTVEV